MVTVRFAVGEDQDRAVVRVHARLMQDLDQMPPGFTAPLVKPHAIDDVPILALTLHAQGQGSNELRQIAVALEDEIRTVTDVAETDVIGGQPRQIRVALDPARLVAAGVTPGEVMQALQGSNAQLQAGEFASGNAVYQLAVGAPLDDAADVGSVVVSTRSGGAGLGSATWPA
jgi:multidrug efflux pump subunit AcrB